MKINVKTYLSFERGIMDGWLEYSINARHSVLWFDKPVSAYAEYCFNRQATKYSQTKAHKKAYVNGFEWILLAAEEFKELFRTARNDQQIMRELYNKGIFEFAGDNELITDRLYQMGIMNETEGNYAYNLESLKREFSTKQDNYYL